MSVISSDSINKASKAAVNYLLSQQGQDGLWYELDLPEVGPTSFWVTAYTAYRLSFYPGTEESVQRATLSLLEHYIRKRGWGYNSLTPHDADTTLCVLRLFSRVSEISLELKNKIFLQLVDDYIDTTTGGVRTYSLGTTSIKAWTEPEISVTALFIKMVLEYGRKLPCKEEVLSAALDFLCKHEVSGVWQGYWYPSHAYTTYYALSTLFAMDRDVAALKLRVLDWLGEFDQEKETSFSLAYYGLIISLLLKHTGKQQDFLDNKMFLTLQKILSLQDESGCLAISNVLWLPDYSYQGYTKELTKLLEKRAILSTAAGLEFFSEITRAEKVF